jgi:hypothetical protein
MKQTILAITALTVVFGSVSQAFAYDHHHRVCHRERIHHHWVKRCR